MPSMSVTTPVIVVVEILDNLEQLAMHTQPANRGTRKRG